MPDTATPALLTNDVSPSNRSTTAWSCASVGLDGDVGGDRHNVRAGNRGQRRQFPRSGPWTISHTPRGTGVDGLLGGPSPIPLDPGDQNARSLQKCRQPVLPLLRESSQSGVFPIFPNLHG